MSEKFKFKKEMEVDPERLEQARSYDNKLQELGRTLVGSLHTLVRNVKLYGPENDIFIKPLEKLQECINTIIAMDGSLNMQIAGTSFYLNEMLLRIDSKEVAALAYLQEELQRCNVGGFNLEQSVNLKELRNFIYIFSKECAEESGASGVSGRTLQAFKIRNFEKIQEILQQQEDQEVVLERQKLDRKRYSLVVYARTVHFMRNFIAGLRGQVNEIPMGRSTKFIRDLIDVSYGHSSHFLGVSAMPQPDDRLAYHSVNVTMLTIVFGIELGLDKEQLSALAQAALFHDIGMLDLDSALVEKRTSPTQEEAARLALAPLYSVGRYLRSRQLDLESMHAIVATYDRQFEFGKPIKDLKGKTTMVEQTADLGVFPKIIAITDAYETLVSDHTYSPEQAMTLMGNEWLHRFDPVYMRAFTRAMKGLFTRAFEDSGTKVTIA